MERIIMHIDVNNAFLSWTAIDLLNKGYKYDIRNSYAVIGGDETKRSGIVLAKSNAAKKLGIYTSETLYSARKKCRILKIYPPNYKFYSMMSKKMFDLLSKYSPDIEIASIDECYLDYGKVKSLYGDELKFAHKLKEEIKDLSPASFFLETDAPYLTPEPYRGKPNEPKYMIYTLRALSEALNINEEELSNTLENNFHELFDNNN